MNRTKLTAPASALKVLSSLQPLVIGHRGCSALAPENTLPSFQMAIEAGADLIELDYRSSRDGVPMVIHDATLDRTTNARSIWKRKCIRVADKTAAEIQSLDTGMWFDKRFSRTKVPLLTEALDLICGSDGVALIEQKSGDAATLARLLGERKLINRVVVQSFDWRFLRELHELEPKQILGALGPATRLVNGRKPSSLRSQYLNRRWLDHLQRTGARVCVWNRKVSHSAVRLAHARELRVWIYTIDDRNLARRLRSFGVDGIITNTPGHGAGWFDGL